ncbi:MAG TPA: ATP-binding cassette domain-containing protein [Polyangiales bacterium]|nr:ATP-binding cassette domain-containing protein [Polyangiales bacterium]
MIQFQSVTKRYGDSSAHALQDVSFEVQAGELVALVGGSGSGKTTTLKCINRLIEPDSGEVRVDGKPVRTQPGPALRRHIGYVFQGIGLFPHMSVAENIGITPQLLGWERTRIAARVDVLLDLVELPREFASRAPSALSGGQRQRVGVARALAAEPKLVLMDEPFGALDPVTRDTLGRAYRKLHEQMQLTSVLVTHDMLEALLLADRIIVMQSGRVLANDTPQHLLQSDTHPAVRELLDMPRKQAERLQSLFPAPEPDKHA